MAGSVRINLSVTERVDGVISAYAELTGRTKTAVIMEAVGDRLRYWEAAVRQDRAQRYGGGQAPSSVGVKSGEVVAADTETVSKGRVLSPQEQWNLEVERKKAARAKDDRV
jgi:hypothetical protein